MRMLERAADAAMGRARERARNVRLLFRRRVDLLPWERLRGDLPEPEQTRKVVEWLEGEGKRAASLR